VEGLIMGEVYFPGATTLGITCKDGVILASEKRVSLGYLVVSKTGKKVFKVTETIGAACAGLMGDMQILLREVSAYAKIFELESGRKISVRSVAKVLSNMLFERRYFPYITQTIVGGVDDEGASIYILDPYGSVIQDKYATVGTGAEIAIGVLETGYRDGLTLEDGRELAIRAMKSAMARDAVSGNGIDILIISKNGIKEETIPQQF
jgi:proteasome beta subunit